MQADQLTEEQVAGKIREDLCEYVNNVTCMHEQITRLLTNFIYFNRRALKL